MTEHDVERPPLDAAVLGARLLKEYRAAETARSLYSERWLQDLTAYKGFYPATVATRLKESRKSSVYYRMTTAKVNTMTARLMDLLFPQRAKNWSITPTPDPDLPQEILEQELDAEIQAQAQALLNERLTQLTRKNIVPDDLAMRKLMEGARREAFQNLNTPANRQRAAQARAARMETVIDDQLKECNANGQRRPSWQQNCRAVVTSACLYGMGVIKGPLVERATRRRYEAGKDENGSFVWREQSDGEFLRPYHEAVSIWDLFPDPDARVPEELRHIWQLHLYTDKDLLDLTSFPGFDGAAIRRYMQVHADGDARLETWEAHRTAAFIPLTGTGGRIAGTAVLSCFSFRRDYDPSSSPALPARNAPCAAEAIPSMYPSRRAAVSGLITALPSIGITISVGAIVVVPGRIRSGTVMGLHVDAVAARVASDAHVVSIAPDSSGCDKDGTEQRDGKDFLHKNLLAQPYIK